MADIPYETERFRVDGNMLVVTSSFDPRCQRGAEGELLQTLQAMIEDGNVESVVLDLHRRDSLPSMLVGVIVESHRRVEAKGASMVLRVRPEHLRSLDWAGMHRLFKETGRRKSESGDEYVEFVSK